MAHLTSARMISTVMTRQQWHLAHIKLCWEHTSGIECSVLQQALQNFEWPLLRRPACIAINLR